MIVKSIITAFLFFEIASIPQLGTTVCNRKLIQRVTRSTIQLPFYGIKSLLPSLILYDLHDHPATLLSFDQTNPTKLYFTPRITTRNYTAVRRKKKKRKQLNESRISLREEFSFEGAIIRILASIEPIQHTKTVASLYFSLSLFFLSLPCVEPMILVNFAPSRVVDRERERMATKYRHCEIQWVDLWPP